MKAWLLVLLLVPGALAVPEQDASQIDTRIVSVTHYPEVPQPGQQWLGALVLADGHNVTSVHYQICRVGIACFAPPTPAIQTSPNSWTFDTHNYTAGGQVVDWGINHPGFQKGDWSVGVQYIFNTSEGSQRVPHGIDEASQECRDVGWDVCAASHYFVFDMPGREPDNSNEAPGLGGGLLFALLAVAMLRRVKA